MNSLCVLGMLIYPPRTLLPLLCNQSQRSWFSNVHNLYDWYQSSFHLEKVAATGQFCVVFIEAKDMYFPEFLPCMVPDKEWPQEILVWDWGKEGEARALHIDLHYCCRQQGTDAEWLRALTQLHDQVSSLISGLAAQLDA